MPHQFDNFRHALRSVPVTLGLILLSILGFIPYLLWMYLRIQPESLSFFSFTDFEIVDNQVQYLPTRGEYWRVITPIFLHFGWLHITFNSLWMWELGALIEKHLGKWVLLALVLLCGAGSNIAQYLYSGPSLFGGMSGVVYALLGFCWVYNALLPDRHLAVPRAIIGFMLVWLVFCMVAPTELLGLGSIANAAHLAGLVLGCALAAPVALYRKFRRA